jgi:hypothetical protein
MNPFERHIESLILNELQKRRYIQNREKRGLDVGDITKEEFQDYVDDVTFEENVLAFFHGIRKAE